jgi:sugar/nucleoside kinase (ribokinase family)
MTKDIDVLCVGIAVADVFGKAIDTVPEWGRLLTFDHIEHHIGGCAVNTGVDLARLGTKVAFVGCVANDAAGDFIKKKLASEGLDVSGIVTSDDSATSYTFIMIDSKGNRRYLHHVGANANLSDKDIPDHLLERARLLHIGGSFLMPGMDGQPTANLIRRAKSLGVLTSIDTAYNKEVDAKALIEPSLPLVDIFLPSIEEVELISERQGHQDSFSYFDKYNIPICGIKLGSQGCMIKHNGQIHKLPCFKVNVVDTSGAGDSFMAGFIYGRLHGWDVEMCAKFANAVAAHCVQSIGCSSGIPNAQQVVKFIEAHK